MQLMRHHLGEQTPATIRRLHRDDRDCGNRYRSARHRHCPAVRPAGGDPLVVNLETEAALRLEHLVMRLPLLRHVVVMKTTQDRPEEVVDPLGRGVHQLTLSKVRRSGAQDGWA